MKEQDNGRTEELSSATWQFIVSHREDDVRTLALQARKYPQASPLLLAVVQSYQMLRA